MLQYYFKTMRDEEFQLIPEIREGCWIHIDMATPEDINILSQQIGLEYSDLQDCLDKYEVPRIERIQSTTLIFTRHPTEHEVGLYTAPLTLILAPHYFVTISPLHSHLIHAFIHQKNRLSTLQKPKLLINLLFRITQEFTVHIRKARQTLLRQDKEMVQVESEDIITLTKSEEILNQYTSSLSPLRHVLDSIASGRYTNLHEKDQDLLQDLLNAIKQSEDISAISIKSIRSMRDACQIIFTNNLSKTIKLLTSLTVLIAIPTMIASFLGMNVPIPYQNHPAAFLYVAGFIAFSIIIAIFYFHRKKWI
jgi:magnesium transporter